MKKIFNKINNNPYWTFLISIYSLKDILITSNMCIHYNTNFDWIGFFINTSLAILLFVLIKKYNRMKKEMITFSIVSHVRSKMLFIKHYENTQFLKIPGMTDKEYWDIIGELFMQHLNQEKESVKKIMEKEFNYLSVSEIEKLMSEFYPQKNNNTKE